MDAALLEKILIGLFTAGATYGAIRADLKSLHEKCASITRDQEKLESSVRRSHERIDDHVLDYHHREH